jgi:hypothetical protein
MAVAVSEAIRTKESKDLFDKEWLSLGAAGGENMKIQRLRMSAQKLLFRNVLVTSERKEWDTQTVVRPRNRRA